MSSNQTGPAQNGISAIPCASYGEQAVREAVRQHFQALEVPGLLRPGRKVVLKPNLLMKRRPEEGTTTHPALVRAVILELEELGIEDIVVADSPGGPYHKSALEGIYQASGMKAAVQGTCARLNEDFGWKAVSGGDEHSLCRDWNIISPIVEADFIINLPKLKTHAMMTLSAGIKNLFGCIPGLQKPELHFRFPEADAFGRMLTDLSLVVEPDLTIVDAVVSMEGDGPSAGELKETGMTFAARNVYHLDRAICDYIRLDPRSAPMVKAALELGLCPEDSAGLTYLSGDCPPPVPDYKAPSSKPLDFTARLPGPLKKPVGKVLRRMMAPRPVIRRRECIGCGKCAESCAPGAVALRQNRKAHIDYGACIACYCCHEMCPVKAIGIRRSPLHR